MDAVALRLVPVLFGLAVILLAWPLRGAIGEWGAAWAALLMAVSPAMAYYSRYFIQEMLLVCFTGLLLAALWWYLRRPGYGPAVLAGVSAGLIHATKETSVVIFAAVVLGAACASFMTRLRIHACPLVVHRFRVRHGVAAIIAAAAVVVVLFSSFFTHPQGIIDSIATYWHYLERAGGEGHEKPWWYYVRLLAAWRVPLGPWWSEGAILLLALIGFGVALGGKDDSKAGLYRRFLAFYALFLAAAYSLIAYKTPWTMLGFLHAFILLGGLAADRMLCRPRRRWLAAGVAALLMAASAHLGWQAWRANFRMPADPGNPYVYAHTSSAFLRLADRLEALAEVDPRGHALLVQVVASDGDYWPIPWYARRFEHVGYWAAPPEKLGAPVVIASMDLARAVGERLGEGYHGSTFSLRPGELLVMFVEDPLWEAFMATRGGAPAAGQS
jgi:uncharacterized protein (TIGR03663 family)